MSEFNCVGLPGVGSYDVTQFDMAASSLRKFSVEHSVAALSRRAFVQRTFL
jgi:hypothetical protein